jgi:uncharacterized membrane protein
MHSLSPTVYIVFTAVTAAGVLLQAFVLLAIYFAIRRSSDKLHETLDEVKAKALPAIDSAQSLLNDVSPRLKTATTNLTEVSQTLRGQASHVNATVESLLEKVNVQIERVDEMVTATFNALSQASRAVEMAIGTPARRVSGLLHGLRVGVEVLMKGRKNGGPTPSVEETVSPESAQAEPSAAAKSTVQAEQKPA